MQRVGERVARYGHRSHLSYRFTVVDSAEINAFAIPGGHIYIHRGLMAYLGSEAELAAVLGHEVGHVTARHSVRQQSQSAAWNILGQAVAIGTGVGAAGDVTSALGTALVRGYGRDMELEADGFGAQYLARSGYDPQAMIAVVKVLKNQEDFARAEAQARAAKAAERARASQRRREEAEAALQRVRRRLAEREAAGKSAAPLPVPGAASGPGR